MLNNILTSILLAMSLSLSLLSLSLSLSLSLIYIYNIRIVYVVIMIELIPYTHTHLYLYQHHNFPSIQQPKPLAGDVGFRRWSSETRGGRVDLLISPSIWTTPTWNGRWNNMKPSNCDISWGFYPSTFFSIQDFTERKRVKGMDVVHNVPPKKLWFQGCSLVSTASWDADAAEQHGLGMKKCWWRLGVSKNNGTPKSSICS